MDISIFREHFTQEKLLPNALMNEYTAFKIGGPADLLILPSSAEEIRLAISLCKQGNLPYFVMGKGSNLLVKDAGFRGVVINISKNFEHVERVDDCVIRADAGITLAKLAAFAADLGLSGLEFASGIPGSLGGAVYMNAGAYDGAMSDVIRTVGVIDEDGNEFDMSKSEAELGYRSSIFQKTKYIIKNCTLELEPCDKGLIKEKMLDLNGRRKASQPLDLPSGGSTFKRPEGYYAAKLIDDSGLRGYSIGGAKVSEKHAGFVVNYDNATAQDVIDLMEHIKSTVYEKFGVTLVQEIEVLG